MSQPNETPEILQERASTPAQTVRRIGLTLLVLGLIFGIVIPGFAPYSEIADTFSSLSLDEIAVLLAIFGFLEMTRSIPATVIVPGLRLGRSFIADESSTMISNLLPGPSGTATRFLAYRRYGISAPDFARATVVNSVWNNGVVMLMPAVAIAIASTQTDVPDRVRNIGYLGLGASIVGLVVIIGVVRSERFAFRLGEAVGWVVTFARGMLNRPPASDIGDAVVQFRADTVETVRRVWWRLSIVIIVKYTTEAVLLVQVLRALDVDSDVLPAAVVFGIYTLVRILGMIQITPGGVGVVETLYILGLTWAAGSAGDALEAEIVGAVLVFRSMTYLGPLVIGGVCYGLLQRIPHAEATGDAPKVSDLEIRVDWSSDPA